MRWIWAIFPWAICYVLSSAQPAMGVQHVVSSPSQFSTALAAAAPGDEIILQPGVYSGGNFRAGLRQVTIRSANPDDRAIFDGGGTAIQLSDAQEVTISHIVFRNQESNSLNIDDGGTFATPSSGITLRNLLVQDIQNPGNLDGIKLSGVNNFLIDRVEVRNWGTGGSAVDMVGCHHGLIQNSLFVHTNASANGTTLQPKGGSKDITFRANRIELPRTAGRAIQAGGSTGTPFFRFVDGDSGYEADEITSEGNVVIGGTSAFSWVNIDGGTFHHNLVHRPGNWTARILNENQGNPIIDTQNGKFHDNVVIFNDTANEYSLAVNVGSETLPETFSFARNKWFNLANPTPAGSTPNLPTPEIDGQYGGEPDVSIDEPIVWQFPWGKWVVNATGAAADVNISDFAEYQRATPTDSATFFPLQENPIAGEWESAPLTGESLHLPAFSQAVLIDPAACSGCIPPSGDYDRNGQVNQADYDLWRASFGSTVLLTADGNGNRLIDAADYVVWRDRTSVSGNGLAVPEPANGVFLLLLAAWLGTAVRMLS